MTTKINADANGLTETVDTSGILEIQTNGTAAVIIGVDQNANFTSTGAITVPAGTTAQRPTPVNGMMRYNSNVAVFEVYANNVWSAANVTPAPTNTVAPVISGSAIVGQNLTCTTGTWSGSPSAYFYQWRANSTAISNATANVFTLTSTQTGANITCNVIAQNIAGNSSPATSNSLGPVVLGTTVNYLIVAGGGGGGRENFSSGCGGGGGAGGFQTGSTILQPANTYSITVGAGGVAGVSAGALGGNGGNSSITGLTASVGGGGGGGGQSNPSNGGNGGSGGGAPNGTSTFGTGTAGQGNNGGSGTNPGNASGGGGGGASAAGGNGSTSGNGTGGNGGAGNASSITGTSVTYAGGGGGAGGSSSATGAGGTGGAGGGGTGATYNVGGATSGTANLGGGGGGGQNGSNTQAAGNGGSGVVIISYAGAQQFGGGVITTDGSNTIHTFYTSGSLVPLTALNSSYIIVGGGGGGGAVCGGGGGGGGFYSGSNVTIDANSTYTIVVGAGGTAGPTAASSYGGAGGNSTFSMTSNVAIGGGYGGGGFYSVAAYNGGNGASGGGGGGYWSMGQTSGGTGTAGQGYNGGNALNGTGYPGGGGGGFSSAGANATASQGGNGGNGVSSSISGTLTYYAGGGGGGTSAGSAGAAGLGGAAGSGSGAGSSASAGTGGGGGGGNQSSAGGAGGSGTVIISYPGSTPMMAGGNVTVVSNTVVHTFTSSGYLTPFVNFNNSLRFRRSASASLTRTPSVAGNRQKFTYSAWVKGYFGNSDVYVFLSAGNGNSGGVQNASLYYYQGNLGFGMGVFGVSTDATFTSSAVFRDPAAWYHIVIAFDTTQATDTNRMKLYVNGVQQTFSSVQYPSQNYNMSFNNNVLHRIANSPSNEYYDGYMTEINSIDGQALTPNAFGSFNQYGVWAPVRYAGSYGTNGFYLPFAANQTSTYAGTFNGSNQTLSMPSGPFNIGTADFTFECWINPTSVGTYLPIAVTNATGGLWIGKNSSNFVLRAFSVSDLILTPNQPQAGVWTHIAVTRVSGTAYIFFNGILQVSGAVSQNFASGSAYIGTDAGTLYFPGSISNLRTIIGTGLYTTNFTPPSAPLTAVTNTSLLTLQNSSIVDNSTNAYTITNNNGVTTSVQYPFTTSLAKDASPQGNNWTTNNISLLNGSTYDSMVDVPTLTSANVANYCVVNPLDTGGSTLTNGNLTQTTPSSGYGAMRSTLAVSSGKWYWEVTPTSLTGGSMIGICGVTETISSSTQLYNLATSYTYWSNANKGNNGNIVSYGASYAANDVIGIALDLDGGTITFYKNNSSQGTAYSSLSGTFTPAICDNSNSNASAFDVNYGQQPFVYTPPAGYLPLNTYNM